MFTLSNILIFFQLFINVNSLLTLQAILKWVVGQFWMVDHSVSMPTLRISHNFLVPLDNSFKLHPGLVKYVVRF